MLLRAKLPDITRVLRSAFVGLQLLSTSAAMVLQITVAADRQWKSTYFVALQKRQPSARKQEPLGGTNLSAFPLAMVSIATLAQDCM